jgi:hypothetical protein
VSGGPKIQLKSLRNRIWARVLVQPSAGLPGAHASAVEELCAVRLVKPMAIVCVP